MWVLVILVLIGLCIAVIKFFIQNPEIFLLILFFAVIGIFIHLAAKKEKREKELAEEKEREEKMKKEQEEKRKKEKEEEKKERERKDRERASWAPWQTFVNKNPYPNNTIILGTKAENIDIIAKVQISDIVKCLILNDCIKYTIKCQDSKKMGSKTLSILDKRSEAAKVIEEIKRYKNFTDEAIWEKIRPLLFQLPARVIIGIPTNSKFHQIEFYSANNQKPVALLSLTNHYGHELERKYGPDHLTSIIVHNKAFWSWKDEVYSFKSDGCQYDSAMTLVTLTNDFHQVIVTEEHHMMDSSGPYETKEATIIGLNIEVKVEYKSEI